MRAVIRDRSPQVRVLANNHMRSYISHAMGLLNDKGHDEVVFRAMGRAINKTVAIGE
jgi:DNA-binding protein